MLRVKITGTGSFQGGKEVDNPTLYPLVTGFDRPRAEETVRKKGNNVKGLAGEELFDLWVRQVCGVEKRYYFGTEHIPEGVGPKYPAEYMGFKAGQAAIEAAGVEAQDIDYILFASFTPDQIVPNPACTVAHFLGLKGRGALQINTACSGFLDGMGLANMMIQSGACKRILVVASEHMSAHIDFSDVTTAILFSDGACAAVLESAEGESGILSYISETDYNQDMIQMVSGSCLRMAGGPLVQRGAVNAMHAMLEKAAVKAGKSIRDLDYLIPHQANLRILQRLAERLDIPAERMLQSIAWTGNVSAAAFGIGLDQAFRGRINSLQFKPGNLLGLTTVGGGYTFSGMIYRV